MNNINNFDYLPLSKEALHIIVILLSAWALLALSRKLIRLFRNYMNTHASSAEENRRIETLTRVFRHVSFLMIMLMAGMLVLSEAGISIAPILGAAGVAGIAVGFGAQNLIKDYFNGFFILFENQIHHGDVVEVCGKSGVVENITLRYVSLRDYEGNVHYIPNGLITTVTNKTRGYAYAVMDVGIAYRESIDDVYEVLREVAIQLRASEDFGPRVIDDLEIAGVDNLADSAVVIRCRFKTVVLEQWSVRREFLRRLKNAFDARGIEIPYPHLTVYAGQDKQGNAPAFRLDNSGDTV